MAQGPQHATKLNKIIVLCTGVFVNTRYMVLFPAASTVRRFGVRRGKIRVQPTAVGRRVGGLAGRKANAAGRRHKRPLSLQQHDYTRHGHLPKKPRRKHDLRDCVDRNTPLGH